MEASVGLITILTHIVLGGVLLISGLLKFPNLRGFVVIVATYKIFPRSLTRIIGYTTPFAEVVLGLWLLLGFFPVVITTFAALYFVSLMLMASIVMLRGTDVKNCGCYGADLKMPMTWWKAFENLGWAFLALSLVYAYTQSALQYVFVCLGGAILLLYALHRLSTWSNSH